MAKRGLSQEKARTILRHGEVRGKKLSPRQKRFMGARAGGKPARNRRGR